VPSAVAGAFHARASASQNCDASIAIMVRPPFEGAVRSRSKAANQTNVSPIHPWPLKEGCSAVNYAQEALRAALLTTTGRHDGESSVELGRVT